MKIADTCRFRAHVYFYSFGVYAFYRDSHSFAIDFWRFQLVVGWGRS